MDEDSNVICEVEDCKCGNGKARVHAIAFKHGVKLRYYADCTACSRVTGWHESEADALKELEALES